MLDQTFKNDGSIRRHPFGDLSQGFPVTTNNPLWAYREGNLSIGFYYRRLNG